MLKLMRAPGRFAAWVLTIGLGVTPVLVMAADAAQPPATSANTLLFAGDSRDLGRQLWTTDGTLEQTRPLNYLNSRATGKDEIGWLGNLGKVAIFSAYSPEYGTEPWRTDGTPEGTYLLKDTLSGAGSGLSGDFYYDRLHQALPHTKHSALFWVQGAGHITLWKTDGSREGTVPLHDFPPFSAGTSSFLTLGERTIFWVDDHKNGPEPWVTDGTVKGTQLLANTSQNLFDSFEYEGYYSGTPPHVLAGQQLYFAAPDQLKETPDANTTYSLWRTDGSPAGTQRVSDLSIPAAHQFQFLHVEDNKLYYLVFEDTNLLVEMNGLMEDDFSELPPPKNSVLRVLDLETKVLQVLGELPARGERYGQSPVQAEARWFQGHLYFWLGDTSRPDHVELWRTDGTAAGTEHLFALPQTEVTGDILVPYLFSFADRLHYFGLEGSKPTTLWRINPDFKGATALTQTALTHMPFEPANTDWSVVNLLPFVCYQDRLIFKTYHHTGLRPVQLWSLSAEQPDELVPLGQFTEVSLLASPPEEGVETVNGTGNSLFKPFFLSGDSLWQTDGTRTGTRPVAPFERPIELEKGAICATPHHLACCSLAMTRSMVMPCG